MKHLIAFDVSMGKSYLVTYKAFKELCVGERNNINHSKLDFHELKRLIDDITDGYGEEPSIVFEETGIYSRPLEKF